MQQIVLVAAVARDGGIGRDGDLLWRDSRDQQHFKALTAGHPVVMGRRTWESLPARFRPLPGRRNVVVTRQREFEAPGAEVVHGLDEALVRLADAPQVAVIGGADLYAQAMPLATRLELTEVDAVFAADTFFPEWPRPQFIETAREAHAGLDGTPFAFVRYERVAPSGAARQVAGVQPSSHSSASW